METERDLVNRSKIEDGRIIAVICYGKSQKEAVVASCNERNEADRRALAAIWDEHAKTGSTTVSTVDGQRELPWVLCIRSYFHGEVMTPMTADPELHKRIRDDRSAYQEKRAAAEKSVLDLLSLTR